MKPNFISLCCAALLATASCFGAEAPNDLHLILCIGQSNMAGRGTMTAADREPVANAWKLNKDNAWVPACAPYHFDKTVAAVGPVDTFVKKYLADHPGVQVGVVPCAVGGSGVKTWHAPRPGKEGKNLLTALARAKVAQEKGKFVAILWHQGETDAANWSAEMIANRYPGEVASCVKAVRATIGEDVPFIAGEIGRWPRRASQAKKDAAATNDTLPTVKTDEDHAAKINPAINTLATVVPKCAVVSSEGLVNQDQHHFDRAGQIELGTRYYNAWKKLAQ